MKAGGVGGHGESLSRTDEWCSGVSHAIESSSHPRPRPLVALFIASSASDTRGHRSVSLSLGPRCYPSPRTRAAYHSDKRSGANPPFRSEIRRGNLRTAIEIPNRRENALLRRFYASAWATSGESRGLIATRCRERSAAKDADADTGDRNGIMQ